MLMLAIATGSSPQPRSKLAEALHLMGSTTPNAEASGLFNYMRKPGRDGVRACINCYQLFPVESRAEFLADAFEWRVNRHGFQYILADGWKAGSWDTRRAAGSRESLVAWFRYADFREVSLPFLKQWTNLASLPETFTAWRGGRGPAELIADGLSWSLSRPRAAVYAMRELERSQGAPILLRRQVDAVEALISYVIDQEVVLAQPGPYAVDMDDGRAIEGLAALIEGELDREEAAAKALFATVASDPEKAVFAEWAG